jgi:hypothetical protein
MADPLNGPRLKIEWAKRQIGDLERLIIDWQTGNPYTIMRGTDTEAGKVYYKLVNKIPVPDEAQVNAGAVVHSIRSALDLLACCLARLNGYTNVSETYFPFGKSKDIFESPAVQRKVKKLHPAHARLIRRLKPYKGGNDLLWAIHELDLMDKHTMLIPIGSVSTNGVFANNVIKHSAHGELQFGAPEFASLEDGMIFAAATIGTEVEMDIQFNLTVAFRDIEAIKGEPFIAVLVQFIDLAERIINIFDRMFFKRAVNHG